MVPEEEDMAVAVATSFCFLGKYLFLYIFMFANLFCCLSSLVVGE